MKYINRVPRLRSSFPIQESFLRARWVRVIIGQVPESNAEMKACRVEGEHEIERLIRHWPKSVIRG